MIRNSIKVLTSCVTFLVILMFLFCRITWLYRGNDIEARGDIQGFKNQGDVDVVLIGASTVLRFYSPLQAWKETGITSYNYATSHGKFDLFKEYIRDSRKTNEARLYVIDLRTIDYLNSDVHEPSIRNWADSLNPLSIIRFQGINDFVYTRDWVFETLPSFYFDIIKYHSNKDAPSSEEQWAFLKPGGVQNVDKGYSPYTSNIPFERKQWGDTRGELSAQQLNAMNALLDYCDKESLPALFVCCPYIYAGPDEGLINTCGDMIRERGYDFINFNEHYDEIGLDFSKNFSDINHVNYLGSKKYTHYLAEYISTHYNMPDHRGDPKYSQWDLDYDEFAPTADQLETSVQNIIAGQIEAKEIGERLKTEYDFYKWYSATKNINYTVIIRMGDISGNISAKNALDIFFRDYSIDPAKKTYIGIWNGGNAVVSTSEDLYAESEIGADGGRTLDVCKVSGQSHSINIGGTDYRADESPIQVVVYDNTYQKVLDNVNLIVDSDGSVVLKRPELYLN